MSALDQARMCLAHPLTMYSGPELRKIIAGLVEQIESHPSTPLAKKHKGMRVSANGVMGRIRDGSSDSGVRHMCGVMLKHLEEMAARYYAGDLAAVDEFLQLYCLDERRPVTEVIEHG